MASSHRPTIAEIIRQGTRHMPGGPKEGRPHQIEVVSKLQADVLSSQPAKGYIVQHGTGSGKSLTIAALIYRLWQLKDEAGRAVFHRLLVVTDRTQLDQQLGDVVETFFSGNKAGVLKLGRAEATNDLARFLSRDPGSDEEPYVVFTTMQKVASLWKRGQKLQPDSGESTAGSTNGEACNVGSSDVVPLAIQALMRQLAQEGRKVAIIQDEAHQGRGGKNTDSLHQLLGAGDDCCQPDNVMYFFMTATPRDSLLQDYGVKHTAADGSEVYSPFHCYPLRKAIEDGHVLDPLHNYVIVTPRMQIDGVQDAGDNVMGHVDKAQVLRTAIESGDVLYQKALFLVEQLVQHLAAAKDDGFPEMQALLVSNGKLDALRYTRILRKIVASHEQLQQLLGDEASRPGFVFGAFSDKVELSEADYKEFCMDQKQWKGYGAASASPEGACRASDQQGKVASIPASSRQGGEATAMWGRNGTSPPHKNKKPRLVEKCGVTEKALKYEVTEKALNGNFACLESARVKVVCDKHTTGYNQPRLALMFVDKPMSGALAVQTISRINRTAPELGKQLRHLAVYDFVNPISTIKEAFQTFCGETTFINGGQMERMHKEREAARAQLSRQPASGKSDRPPRRQRSVKFSEIRLEETFRGHVRMSSEESGPLRSRRPGSGGVSPGAAEVKEARPLSEVLAAVNKELWSERYNKSFAEGLAELCNRLMGREEACDAVLGADGGGGGDEVPDVQRARRRSSDAESSEEDVHALVSVLQRLLLWPVDEQLLQETEVHKSVARLVSHANVEVASLAEDLMSRWQGVLGAAEQGAQASQPFSSAAAAAATMATPGAAAAAPSAVQQQLQQQQQQQRQQQPRCLWPPPPPFPLELQQQQQQPILMPWPGFTPLPLPPLSQ